MTNPVLTAISERRSIRQYKPEQITEEQLRALLRAAVESPSARNAQPWHFTVVQKSAVLAEVNAEATAILGREGDIFYAAPTAIFISADRASDWAKLDSGIAVQNIALAAQSMGLGSVILGLPAAAFKGPRADYFAGLLKFPATHEFAVAIAVGYPDVTKEAHPVEGGRIDYIR
ncbi:MAG: nitroreductase [Firmicutes bacterium]|nr:nitroreductase [Bacillota bacterium]